MNKNEARIFGYIATSEFDNNPPAEEQARQIAAKAAEIEGEFVAVCVEHDRAPEDSFRSRPEFLALLFKRVRRGDHIVVYRLAILDANPHRLDTILNRFVIQGVNLHTLAEEGDKQLEMDPQQVRILSSIWHLFRRMRIDYIATTTRRSLRAKKAAGQVHHRYPPFGKRRIRRKVKGRVEQHDVWDETECEQIREIKRRKDTGETFDSIARDFYDRGLKKADGRTWVTKPKRKRKLNTSSLRRAHDYYKGVLSRGLDLGDDDA